MKTRILILAAAAAALVPFVVFSQNARPVDVQQAAPAGTVAAYKLLKEDSPLQLEARVNEAIKAGWRPLGGVVVTPDMQNGGYLRYIQAMTQGPRG